ncbi:IS66 family transposase [Cytophagaceae bacterium ABcell3]|nr:IS66 family transposase [Cytophagaceae bacterium ABcell3]WMJ72117.1 IS66 family transposase [Cytophagaceae bacterium ABcell3]WMJ72238.1 IS66 family transposase [Cytophagaceae bacterium ABcell3]
MLAEGIDYKEKYEEAMSEIALLKFELKELKRLIYGTKSERFVPSSAPEQLNLGLGEEQATAPEKEEVVRFKRVKKETARKHPGRLPIPAHVPRVEEVVEPEEDTSGMKKIGEEVTEVLEYTTGKFHVRKIVRPKYAKPEGEGVAIGELPYRAIEKGIAGASLVAFLVVSKYVDHLPLYRQIQIFKREGLNFPSSTMSDWVKQGVNKLKILYELHKKRTLQAGYLMADETPIKVLDKDKKSKIHRGYYWVYYDPVGKQVLFDYRPGRGSEGPSDILKGFQGYLQCDGYNVYDMFANIKGITLFHCMAHARRMFEKALDNDKENAEHALKEFQKLYDIERKAREAGMSFEERKESRLDAKTTLDDLEEWMKNLYPNIAPRSPIGKALEYSLSRWERLSIYLEDGKLEIDNNLVENSIRPVAIGRKNYLFAGSHDAAQRAAQIYSLVASCKINGVNPLEWMKDVLERIDNHPVNRLEELLPGKWVKL